MKKHLERKVKPGKAKPKLKDLDPDVLPAAWSILRWCVLKNLNVIYSKPTEGVWHRVPPT